ncbi:hypothetical protein M501DRAFT_1027942 [Patellaria atrata CBS 101060]|uniref:Uncharacterized protein n=1 Tax=Patellaria atrata CBS 101060 TaxID=1346257 RepID=A0A9P4VWV0_9PEZI|nr:hypothetical protein M501DRAFT_1027942 [Patellaria atrata CBS 101060]
MHCYILTLFVNISSYKITVDILPSIPSLSHILNQSKYLLDRDFTRINTKRKRKRTKTNTEKHIISPHLTMAPSTHNPKLPPTAFQNTRWGRQELAGRSKESPLQYHNSEHPPSTVPRVGNVQQLPSYRSSQYKNVEATAEIHGLPPRHIEEVKEYSSRKLPNVPHKGRPGSSSRSTRDSSSCSMRPAPLRVVRPKENVEDLHGEYSRSVPGPDFSRFPSPAPSTVSTATDLNSPVHQTFSQIDEYYGRSPLSKLEAHFATASLDVPKMSKGASKKRKKVSRNSAHMDMSMSLMSATEAQYSIESPMKRESRIGSKNQLPSSNALFGPSPMNSFEATFALANADETSSKSKGKAEKKRASSPPAHPSTHEAEHPLASAARSPPALHEFPFTSPHSAIEAEHYLAALEGQKLTPPPPSNPKQRRPSLLPLPLSSYTHPASRSPRPLTPIPSPPVSPYVPLVSSPTPLTPTRVLSDIRLRNATNAALRARQAELRLRHETRMPVAARAEQVGDCDDESIAAFVRGRRGRWDADADGDMWELVGRGGV